MCFLGGKSAPAVPALPPALPPLPTPADPEVAASRSRQRQRAGLAGKGGTVKTGGLGLLAPAETARKTVVGT
jgi:hypothetical protein